MNKSLYLACIFCLALTAWILESEGSPSANDMLVSLGTVDNKTIYYENTPRNWMDAKSFCEESGMKLLEITSLAQQTFLKGKYSEGEFHGVYWTAGHDAMDRNQFVWGESSTRLDDFGNELRLTGPYTCIAMWINPLENFNGIWYGSLCSTASPTLCEE